MVSQSNAQVVGPLITAGAAIIAALITAVATILATRHKRRSLERELAEKRKFSWLLGPLQRLHEDAVQKSTEGKTVHSRRLISHQLLVMEDALKRMGQANGQATIDILGINALGPLHQGREILIKELKRGTKIRVLVLDLLSQTFVNRRREEGDTVGRFVVEWNAARYILADIVEHVKSEGVVPHVEIRVHDKEPQYSLIMVNAQEPDGVILDNVYPPHLDTRGIEGHASVIRRDSEDYKRYFDFFERTWDKGRPLDVTSLPSPTVYL